MTLWSYVSQWFGYLAYCASATDPACRPFIGFLALSGASGGAFGLMVIGLVSMLNGWERDVLAAKRRRELAAKEKPRRAEPALGVAPVRAPAAHAEPFLPVAGALAMAPKALHSAPAVAVALHRATRPGR
ncbi:MAG: hypothetical protein ACM3SS_07720 [Rhodospirillaceae bacterium]